MLESMITHLLHCVSPQAGGRAGQRTLAFTEGVLAPGVSLLFHEPREGNPESRNVSLDLGGVTKR